VINPYIYLRIIQIISILRWLKYESYIFIIPSTYEKDFVSKSVTDSDMRS